MRPALVRSVYTYILYSTYEYILVSILYIAGLAASHDLRILAFSFRHTAPKIICFYTYKSSGSDWIECVCPTPDTWHLLLHPLQPWQARFLCGDSDYCFIRDSVHCTYVCTCNVLLSFMSRNLQSQKILEAHKNYWHICCIFFKLFFFQREFFLNILSIAATCTYSSN